MPQRISIDSQMLHAFWNGITPYQPVCSGVILAKEIDDPATTTRNLKAIMASQVEGASRGILIPINHAGRVLIVFRSGESYFATGFRVGMHCERVEALARFLLDHNEGDWTDDAEHLLRVLRAHPVDQPGPIWLPYVA